MAEPFLGEIRAVGFNFAPRGWATCDGQLLPIAQNTALFSLLGTNYGGNGTSNFALPNLRDRTPVGTGEGQGIHEHVLGEEGGSADVALIASEMPAHNHLPVASSDPAELQAPGPDRALARAQAYTNQPGNTTLDGQALGITGGGLPHNNMAPSLVMNFIIALEGVFPQRP
jgi:microcystin-dependent protein